MAEFSVYPLFSPQSLIAEGTANFGIDVAFPGEERVGFEREKLFPFAGLDPAAAAKYYDVVRATSMRSSYAGNEAARRYLTATPARRRPSTGSCATRCPRDRAAEQRLRFFDQYRSYVINYNLRQGPRAPVRRSARRHLRSSGRPLARVR